MKAMLTYGKQWIDMVKVYMGKGVSNEDGQGMVEYGLIIALVAVVLIAALKAMSGGAKSTFNTITTELGGTPAS